MRCSGNGIAATKLRLKLMIKNWKSGSKICQNGYFLLKISIKRPFLVIRVIYWIQNNQKQYKNWQYKGNTFKSVKKFEFVMKIEAKILDSVFEMQLSI